MKKIILILVLTVILMGCGIKNPAEQYKKYSDMTSEYKVEYKIQIEESYLMGELKLKTSYLEKNGKKKSILTGVERENHLSLEIFEPENIVCTDADYTSQVGQKCTKFESIAGKERKFANFAKTFSNYSIDNSSITYEGKDSILDRKCDIFEAKLNKIDANTLFGNMETMFTRKSTSRTALTLRICIDRETGVPLWENITSVMQSELNVDGEPELLISKKAISFTTEVDDSEFEIPVKLQVIDSGCDANQTYLVLDSLVELTDELKINLVQGKTNFSYVLGEKTFTPGQPVFVKTPKPLSFSNTQIEICAGDSCVKDQCRILQACLKESESPEICNQEKDCMFNEGYCQIFNCYNFKEPYYCNKIDKCTWISTSTSPYCTVKTCNTFKNQNACEASSLTCEWNTQTNRCVEFSCYTKTTESSCNQHKDDCFWSVPPQKGVCGEKVCYTLESQKECESGNNCKWDGTRCNQITCQSNIDKNSCYNDDKCYWQENSYSKTGGTCLQKNCYDYKTSTDCKNAPVDCLWKNNICMTDSCSAIYDQTSCELGASCFWKIYGPTSQAKCSPHMCSAYTTKYQCENSDKVDCDWIERGTTSYCSVQGDAYANTDDLYYNDYYYDDYYDSQEYWDDILMEEEMMYDDYWDDLYYDDYYGDDLETYDTIDGFLDATVKNPVG